MTPFYRAKPAPAQGPRREYKQAPPGMTEDNRPPGRKLGQWDPHEEGSARMEVADPEKEGNKRVMIYLSKVKAPPLGAVKWWKDEMRRKVTQTIERELGVRATVHGVRWHYSHPLERGLDTEFPALQDTERIKEQILRAVRIGFQSWEIKGSVVEDWVDVVILDLDGGKRGERASQRAEDIAKANNWKLAIRAATWLGPQNSREHYEGKHTALQLTIVGRSHPPEELTGNT